MNVDFTRSFNKQFAKLSIKKQEKARLAIALYLENSLDPRIRYHPLTGEWQDHVSISAGGDLRLHFKIIDKNTILFVAIGSHSQLYK